MFFTTAYAEEPAASAAVTEPSPLAGMLPILLMVALFYFLLVRPQQKKINEHKKMVAALRRGDKVLTNGGLYGTIHKVEDDVLVVEIAPETRVKLDKNAVSNVITRSEPADSANPVTVEAGTDEKSTKKKSSSKAKAPAND